MTHLCLLTTALVFVALSCCAPAAAQPKPGDVFREYPWFNEKGDAGQALRAEGIAGRQHRGDVGRAVGGVHQHRDAGQAPRDDLIDPLPAAWRDQLLQSCDDRLGIHLAERPPQGGGRE